MDTPEWIERARNAIERNTGLAATQIEDRRYFDENGTYAVEFLLKSPTDMPLFTVRVSKYCSSDLPGVRIGSIGSLLGGMDWQDLLGKDFNNAV